MKRTWLVLFVIFVLSHGLFAATWSKWNNVTVGGTAGNIGKWNNVTIGTTAGNIGAWNGLVSPGGGGSNPTIVQHVINNNGSGGASSVSATLTSTTSAESVIVAWIWRGDGTTVATPTTSGTTCTFSLVANTQQNGAFYLGAYVATGCGSGVTGVTMTNFGVEAIAVITLSNSVGADVAKSNDNGFGAGASWTSTATAAMASGNGVILCAVGQYRNVGGSESTTFGGSFTALDSTQNDSSLGIMLATAKWSQPGTTTGQACTGTLSRTNGSEQAYAAALVIK